MKREAIEAIVFDVDGVLIDVSQSFRKTIVATVQFYFKKILKYKGSEDLVRLEEIQLFKEAGGFNNDWELTESFVLFYLAKSVRLDSKDLAVLRYQEPFLDGFVVTGVSNFEQAVFGLLDEKEKDLVLGSWNKALIRQIFQEMYAGDKTKEFYGFKPIYFKGAGTVAKEVALVDKDLITKPFAVITGRAPAEASDALRLTGLKVNDGLLVSDDGIFEPKPSPQSLNYISDKMDIKLGIYIGDVADDLQMVINFNAQKKDKRFLSAMVGEAADKYKEADIIAKDVNEVLKMVHG